MENKECSCKDDVRNPGAGMGMTLLVLCMSLYLHHQSVYR